MDSIYLTVASRDEFCQLVYKLRHFVPPPSFDVGVVLLCQTLFVVIRHVYYSHVYTVSVQFYVSIHITSFVKNQPSSI